MGNISILQRYNYMLQIPTTKPFFFLVRDGGLAMANDSKAKLIEDIYTWANFSLIYSSIYTVAHPIHYSVCLFCGCLRMNNVNTLACPIANCAGSSLFYFYCQFCECSLIEGVTPILLRDAQHHFVLVSRWVFSLFDDFDGAYLLIMWPIFYNFLFFLLFSLFQLYLSCCTALLFICVNYSSLSSNLE